MERTWVDHLVSQMYRHASARPLGPPSPDGLASALELMVRGRPIRILVAVYDGPDEPSHLPRWVDELVSEYLGGWDRLREMGISRIDVWIPHGLVEAFQSDVPESVGGVSVILRDMQELNLPMEEVETATRSVVEAMGEVDVGAVDVGKRRGAAGPEARPSQVAGAELELEEPERGARVRGERIEELLQELLRELRSGGRVERDPRVEELERALRELSREVRELKGLRGGESLRIESLERRVEELSRSIDMLLMLVKFLASGATVTPSEWPARPVPRGPSRAEARGPASVAEPRGPRAEGETETVKDMGARPAREMRPAPGEGVSLDLLEEFARDNPWADVLSRKDVKGDEG